MRLLLALRLQQLHAEWFVRGHLDQFVVQRVGTGFTRFELEHGGLRPALQQHPAPRAFRQRFGVGTRLDPVFPQTGRPVGGMFVLRFGQSNENGASVGIRLAFGQRAIIAGAVHLVAPGLLQSADQFVAFGHCLSVSP